MANRTFLRGICRVDVDQRNTSYGSLIGHELSKLVETPRTMVMSLRLLNRSLCHISNTLKIFEGDQGQSVFSLHNQSLGDTMVSIPSEPRHSARQFLEMPFSRFGPNTLKLGLKKIRLGSDILDFLTRMHLAIAVYCQVLDTEIYAKNSFGIIRRCFRNFNYNAEVEHPFDEDQVGLTSDPIQSSLLILPEANRNSLSALKSNQRNFLKSLPREDSLIVNDGAIKPKLWFDGLVPLIGFADLGDGSDSELGREAKMLSDGIVNCLMDFNLVGAMQRENRLCYVVASLVKPLHCFTEHLMLLWRGVEFHHQGLKHSIEDYLQRIYSYRTQLLPTLKDGVSAAEVLR